MWILRPKLKGAKHAWVNKSVGVSATQAKASWWDSAWNQFAKKADYTVAIQEKNENSTLAFYKKLIAIRHNDSVLALPENVLQYNNTGSALIVRYSTQNNNRWVIINLNPKAETTFDLPLDMTGDYADLISQKTLSLSQQMTLKAGELLILKVL